MKKKIYVIGAGGIGSWLLMYLRYYADRGQLDNMELIVMDPDKVETKNLKYSNFVKEDIGKFKAKILGNRYKFKPKVGKLINPSQIKDADLVILAVDNSQARDLIYKSKHFWIDCRSKGMAYSVFFKSERTTHNTLNLKRPAESCQYENRLEEGFIDCGNVISAVFGVAQVLNYFRGKMNISEIIGTV